MSSFSPEFVAWPSIGALNTVIRARAKASSSSSESSSGRPREEDEEDWASAWQSRLTGASFNYRAKIKLHGSNAAVTLFSGGFRVQSRNRFIDDENKGMSGWVKRHADYWSGQWDRMRSSLLHCSDRTFSEAACCTVFGEWCGPGVQKGSVVAVEQIPEHIFAVFAILVGDVLLVEPQQISTLLSSSSSSSSTPSYPPNLHVLPWLSYDPLLLSFSSSSSSSAPFAEAITRMNSIVEAIEEEDPFISQVFNIKGPGEGAVWYPLLEQEWSWYWQNALPRSLFGALSFKTKGTLHQMTKSSLKRHQTTKERKTTSPVKWQTELVSNEEELVEMFVTSARLLQAFNEVIQEENEELDNEEVKRRMTEWLVKDIKKESVAERELARSTLGCSVDNWTKVSSLIHQRVQSWSSSSSSQHLFQQQQRTTSKTEEKIRSNGNGGNKSLFRGLCFCFSDAVSFGDKSKWTKLIKENGGNTSYFLSFKNCQYLIATEEEVRNVIHPQKQERQQHKRGKVWDALQYLQQQNGEGGNLRASLSSSASSSSQKFMIVDTKFVEKSVESGKLEEFEHDLLRRLKKEEGDITSREIEQKLSDREAIKNLPKALVWSYGKSSDGPKFPEHNYEVVKMDVLQCMDFKANNNKFYVMELHASNDYNMYSSNDGDEGTYFMYRIFTHHGRTDELETKKNCAQRECRYLRTLNEAEVLYDFVLATKLASDKGYKKVDLVSVSPNIVSPKLQKEKLQKEEDVNSFSSQQRQQQPTSTLPKPVQQLVQLLYKEASESVTRTVIARITTDGIETPLGILSLTQIQRGEDVLLELSHLAMQPESSERDEHVEKLSQEFYSMIPHRLGTNKAEIRRAILSSPQLIEEKQNLLQLMRDIISVSNARSRAKNMAEIDKMYNALECDIQPLKQDSPQYRSISEHFLNRPSSPSTTATTPQLRIEGIYALKQQTSGSSSTSSFLRSSASSSSSFGSNLLSSFWDEGGESEDRGRQSEERLLFHGSRLSNYVGLLSRGILLPKVIVSQGITSRTDFGFLGAGIYFSDNSYASLKYTTPLPPATSSSSTQFNHSNKKNSSNKHKNKNKNNNVNNKEKEEGLRLMLLVNVKLGRMKDFVKITPHLVEPPAGYDSCHGVKHGSGDPPVESDFKEDEYVVYDAARQKLAYLVAFSLL
ncbi:Poly(ADP-ribose) polymerase catalytic domain protein [Balamuthia mandrillaris]